MKNQIQTPDRNLDIELADLRAFHASIVAHTEAHKAEQAHLRADAARYRFLRRETLSLMDSADPVNSTRLTAQEYDAIVDRKIAEEAAGIVSPDTPVAAVPAPKTEPDE